ncbi:MAG: biopolymer transporter ExbD [Ignavibacterium sp.]
MKFEIRNKPIAAFNFASLTDIVMLLLIFFLLTSQFVIQTGVKVKLPGSKQNEQSTPTQLIVTVTEAGGIFIGSDPTTMNELAAKLNLIKQSTREENLIIRADKSVAIDLVIQVIDAAKSIGIDKFTIQTEKEEI